MTTDPSTFSSRAEGGTDCLIFILASDPIIIPTIRQIRFGNQEWNARIRDRGRFRFPPVLSSEISKGGQAQFAPRTPQIELVTGSPCSRRREHAAHVQSDRCARADARSRDPWALRAGESLVSSGSDDDDLLLTALAVPAVVTEVPGFSPA